MNSMRKLLWMLKCTANVRTLWIISSISPIVMQFSSTYLMATSFKFLFIFFDSKNINNLFFALVTSFFSYLLNVMQGMNQQYVRTKVTSIMKANLSTMLLQKYLKLRLRDSQKTHSGTILSYFNTYIDSSLNILFEIVDGMILPVALALGYFITTIYVSWEIAMFYVLMIIPIAVISFKYIIKFRKTGDEIQKSFSEFSCAFTDIFSGHEIIKLFSLENYMAEKVQEKSKKIYDFKLAEATLNKRYQKILQPFSYAFYTFPIMIGFALVMLGRTALPDIIFVSRFTYQIRSLATIFITMTSSLQSKLSALDIIYDFFSLEEEEEDSPVTNIPPGKNSITIDNLSVRYGKKTILDAITINAVQGQTIGIIGASGSGKSTLLKAIMNFVDYEGVIKIMETDIKSVAINDIRKYISYISQDISLFPGTIYENIIYGKTNATYDEIMNSCKISECYDFISSLPDGIHYLIDDQGKNISVGQRQRIAIARALLKESSILIFDEATSALDYNTESKILHNVMKCYSGIFFVCTHRLHVLQMTDKIYLVSNGRIALVNKISDLMDSDGNLSYDKYMLHINDF